MVENCPGKEENTAFFWRVSPNCLYLRRKCENYIVFNFKKSAYEKNYISSVCIDLSLQYSSLGAAN
ncbi:MAG: hypothetical protein J6R54_00840, partial [Bacteroidaceae bacterium]|nr:hypothetical protein [Bacteroidaceae bacterium]